MKFNKGTRNAVCCAALLAVPLMLGVETEKSVENQEEITEDKSDNMITETVEDDEIAEDKSNDENAEDKSNDEIAEDNSNDEIAEDKSDDETNEDNSEDETAEDKSDDETAEDNSDDETNEGNSGDETAEDKPKDNLNDKSETTDKKSVGMLFEQPKQDDSNLPVFFSSGLENKTPESQADIMIRNYMRQFDGKTIVDISFEGASPETLPTVKSTIMSHVGDEFNTDTAFRDRDALRDIGFFYDAYQTFVEIPEGVMITYHVLENPVLKEVNIIGNTIFSDDELKKLIKVHRNAIVNNNTLNESFAAIQEKYRGDGYIRMKITDMNIDTNGLLTIKINEGTLEGYKVKGNTKTKDYVIIREMRQKPGEVFNAKLARRSIERVYNLGYFEDVNVKMLPGVEPNAMVMEINVKEKRTGTFGIGAGYSTKEGLLGVISISDTNFRGTGDAIGLSFETSADDDDAHGYTFFYRKPWLDSHETAGVFRLYNRTYQYYDYDTHGDLKERYMRKYSGGELTVSRPMSEYSTNFITLRQRKDTYVRHIADGNAGDRSGALGADWRKYNFGTTRSVILQHVTDTRDNIYNPMTGGRVSLDAEFGGLLGGDFTFQKYNIEHQQFYKAGGHSQVWALKAAYGIGEGHLTEFNQFRVGGQNSLRGYRDDQFRGNRMTLATLEYRFPLAKKVQGIFFTDWGGAWNNDYFPESKDIYGSVGTGVALNTPLGPLRLDYGRGKQGGRFHFSVGGGF